MASENRIVHNPEGKSHVWKHFGLFSSEDGTPVNDKAVCQHSARSYISSKPS